MPEQGAHLVVNPADLTDAEIRPAHFPEGGGLAPGRCLLRIDRFAMTANNVTYGRASRQLGYWEFFPHAGDYGRIPAWGFADVIQSNSPDVREGWRVYGFLPMSTHLEIEPGQMNGHSMMDVSAHRADKAPIYNQYLFTKADPAYRPEHEGLISLYRPLYTTAFLLDDFHRRNDFFGAEAVAITSASSKTSLGLAHALKAGGGARSVGLTGAANRAFVEGLGLYDQVVAYDELDAIGAKTLAYVDMAGNGDVRRALHNRFGDGLTGACLVGGTHWTSRVRDSADLPGAKPQFFFAPTYAQERVREWGVAGFHARLGEAWAAFIADAARWTDVRETRGPDASLGVYLDCVGGRIPPNVGAILSLAE